jgi:outer membrane receptor for ferric coprogen and ferric-rhodotorulic acid
MPIFLPTTRVARSHHAAAALFLIAGVLASAQTADDAVFELSPFEVSVANDRGYTATASLAGGRLSTNLRDTAAAVTVLTEEFLSDIGATTFLEAARWAPSSVPQSEIDGGSLYNDYSVSFRGLGAGFQSRNYFRWYINSDTYNTARIDFARGPNSLVFGDSGVGGIANVSSKQALGSDRVEVALQVSDWGGIRSELDIDFKLSATFNLRVAAMAQDFDDWQEVGSDKREGLFATATWRPYRSTSVRIEGEYGRLHRVISTNRLDQMSRWNGVTTNPGPIGRRDPVPASLTRWNVARLVYVDANPEWGILNWEGFAATSGGPFGTGLLTVPQTGMPDFAVLPDYKYSLQAPNGGVRNPYWTASLFVDQRLGRNFHLELAANLQFQERDITRWFFDQIYVEVNQTLPNGQPNPYLGEWYGWARHLWDIQTNDVLSLRASLAWLWENDWSKHRTLLSAGYRDDRFETRTDEIVRVNGPQSDVRAETNRVFIYRYASQRGQPQSLVPASDPVSGIETRRVTTSGFFSEKPVSYLQAAASSTWLRNGRLNTIAGYRTDFYKERINNAALDQRDPANQALLAFGDAMTTDKQDVTSLSFSSVYHATKSLSIFGGYSESFDAGSTARTISGGSLQPLISNGLEAGLRLQLWDGRVIGSITYYQNEQQNNRIAGESAAINEIWSLIGQTQNEVRAGYTDRQTYEGTGWEFDFTAMPRNNLRVMFNFSLPDTQLREGLLDTQAYFNANAGLWESEAARLAAEGDANRAASVRNRIAAISNRIENFTAGRRLNNTFDYTANLFVRYFFTDGALAGFSMGGGYNFRGQRLVGNSAGNPFDYIYAQSYQSASLVLGFDRSLAGGDLTVQLNVSNLFDDEIVRRSGNLGFVVMDPRNVRLSIRYRF